MDNKWHIILNLYWLTTWQILCSRWSLLDALFFSMLMLIKVIAVYIWWQCSIICCYWCWYSFLCISLLSSSTLLLCISTLNLSILSLLNLIVVYFTNQIFCPWCYLSSPLDLVVMYTSTLNIHLLLVEFVVIILYWSTSSMITAISVIFNHIPWP